MNTFQGRQGDVLIERVDALPEGLLPAEPDKNRYVLAYGEVTGHAHAVTVEERVKMYKALNDPSLWLVVAGDKGGKPVEVKHDEHDTIPLPPGIYKVSYQEEYVPGELPRRVAD